MVGHSEVEVQNGEGRSRRVLPHSPGSKLTHYQGPLLRLVFVILVELKLTCFDGFEQVPG
jgi:hypothetical protein